MSFPTPGNNFSPKNPFTPSNPAPRPYENPGSHTVVFNSANKTSGTTGNFLIPIQMSSILNSNNIHYVKILNVSGINIASPGTIYSLYVSIPTLTQPFSYNAKTGLENTIVGFLPPYTQTSSGATTFMCGQNDNAPVYIGDASGVLKNGFFNIQIVDPQNNVVNPSTDIQITLQFS